MKDRYVHGKWGSTCKKTKIENVTHWPMTFFYHRTCNVILMIVNKDRHWWFSMWEALVFMILAASGSAEPLIYPNIGKAKEHVGSGWSLKTSIAVDILYSSFIDILAWMFRWGTAASLALLCSFFFLIPEGSWSSLLQTVSNCRHTKNQRNNSTNECFLSDRSHSFIFFLCSFRAEWTKEGKEKV